MLTFCFVQQKTHPDRFTMDIIASREIEKGEEIIIYFGPDGNENKHSQHMIRQGMVRN